MSDDPMSEMPPPRAPRSQPPAAPTTNRNHTVTVTPPKPPLTPPDSEEEPLSEARETKGARVDYDSDQDLMLHFKLTEYSIITEITKVAHTLEKQRAAEVQFKASILEEVRALTFKVDMALTIIQENQDSLLALLQRAPPTVQPTVPPADEPLAATKEGATEDAPKAQQQVGAGMDFDSLVTDTEGAAQVGGCGGLYAKTKRPVEPHPQHPIQPKPEDTPISLEELAEIKHDDNLKYLWIYQTYYHDVPYKMRVTSLFLSDAEEILTRGGVILPHKKHAKDWDQFVLGRKKWAAKQHFTHCREKS
jgi:hypothetical protein